MLTALSWPVDDSQSHTLWLNSMHIEQVFDQLLRAPFQKGLRNTQTQSDDVDGPELVGDSE